MLIRYAGVLWRAVDSNIRTCGGLIRATIDPIIDPLAYLASPAYLYIDYAILLLHFTTTLIDTVTTAAITELAYLIMLLLCIIARPLPIDSTPRRYIDAIIVRLSSRVQQPILPPPPPVEGLGPVPNPVVVSSVKSNSSLKKKEQSNGRY